MPRVIVVGGSVGGLTAALYLRDLGYEVQVYERSPVRLQGRGAGIVLNPATVRYLLQKRANDLDQISVASHSLQYLGRDGEIAHQQAVEYQYSSYNALYGALLSCLEPDRYHIDHEVVGFEDHGNTVAVQLVDGRRSTCDLLVCADGIRSPARETLLPATVPEYAGYVAWRGTADPAQMSERSKSLLEDAITYCVMPDSHALAYTIPVHTEESRAGHQTTNWLWYRNVPEGPARDAMLTDRNGVRRTTSLPPGAVQEDHIRQLYRDAEEELPAPLYELLVTSETPFVQAIFDVDVLRMAFGRVCLIGDAAFACRPHAAAGSAKAAEDAFQLSQALAATDGDVLAALAQWEPRQLELGRSVLERTRAAGQRSQFEGTWNVGDPLPFGLYRAGDSEMPSGS